ncbi:MAG: WG repeat-containing protein [Oscillospiraceae bacterium]|nr:WG repeat-containing protein [Oscillospiraceae bacterium]
MKKRMLAILLALAICVGMITGTVFSASDEAQQAAEELYDLGIFQGAGTKTDGTPDFRLDEKLTRAEAVTLLVRLLGKENEAVSKSWATPFTDVEDWAMPYVGYAYANGLTSGVAATEFGSWRSVSATQYLTFLLRALGYTSGSDFAWDSAWTLTDQLGITKGEYVAAATFTRGDAAIVSCRALDTSLKNETKTLRKVISDTLDDTTAAVKRVMLLGGTSYYDYAESFKNGYAFAIRDGVCGYVSAIGVFTPCYTVDFYTSDYSGDQYYALIQLLGASTTPQFAVSEDGIYPYYDNDAGAWGYKNIYNGEIVLEPVYAEACPFSEGRAIVRYTQVSAEDARYWVINTKGADMFDTAYVFELHYQDGLLNATAESGGVLYNCLYDTDGTVIVYLAEATDIVRSIDFHASASCRNGYALRDESTDPNHIGVFIDGIETSQLFYYINTAGAITAVLPSGAETGLGWNRDSNAAFYKANGKYGLFNADGKITEAIYTAVTPLQNGISFVSEDGVTYYPIKANGSRIGTEDYSGGGACGDNKLIPAAQEGAYGYISTTGATVIPFQYAAAEPFSEGIGFVRETEDGMKTLINTDGDVITGSLTVLDSSTASEGFYLISTPQGYCHIYAVY